MTDETKNEIRDLAKLYQEVRLLNSKITTLEHKIEVMANQNADAKSANSINNPTIIMTAKQVAKMKKKEMRKGVKDLNFLSILFIVIVLIFVFSHLSK